MYSIKPHCPPGYGYISSNAARIISGHNKVWVVCHKSFSSIQIVLARTGKICYSAQKKKGNVWLENIFNFRGKKFTD